ncbi:hypothetical protein [Antribacter gilvus]|uniref:hypothetical protein n=1 Tax=Antribacter gilvus TaxID=2304675 RepID=UPI000F76C037|nr:hypothetical protein [Antribacter gilvus]
MAERRASAGYLARLVGVAGQRRAARAPRQIAWRPVATPGRPGPAGPEGRPPVRLVPPEPPEPGTRPGRSRASLPAGSRMAGPTEQAGPEASRGDVPQSGPVPGPRRSAPGLRLVPDAAAPARRDLDDGRQAADGQPSVVPEPAAAQDATPPHSPATSADRSGRPSRRRPGLQPQVAEQVERAIDRLVTRSAPARGSREPGAPFAPAARATARPVPEDLASPASAVVAPLRVVPPADLSRDASRPARAPQVHIGTIEITVQQPEQQGAAPVAHAAPARPAPSAADGQPGRLSHRLRTFGHGQG